jgi:hypothetical protein
MCLAFLAQRNGLLLVAGYLCAAAWWVGSPGSAHRWQDNAAPVTIGGQDCKGSTVRGNLQGQRNAPGQVHPVPSVPRRPPHDCPTSADDWEIGHAQVSL